ncbi:MAG TPA: hypothetical protein VGM80_09085 [Gaiellaceae bacterium]|jgi:hypothetical protein
MAERRFMVGERVLASRDQSGENHEEATVYDFYELLLEGSDKIPQVVVDFDDGQRVLMRAEEPNVRAIEEDEMNDDIDDDEIEFDPDDDAIGSDEDESDDEDLGDDE